MASATCSTSTIQTQALAAADPDLNFNNYDRVVILIKKPSSLTCTFGGVGNVRAQSKGTLDGNSQYFSRAWIFIGFGSTALNGKVGGTAPHEYGHNLGPGTPTRSNAVPSRSAATTAVAPSTATRPT